jgi:protein TonB
VDRLGFTLFLAALVHLALILGVGFTMVKPAEIRHTMDITLATFKSEKRPRRPISRPRKTSKAAAPWTRSGPQDHRGGAVPGQQDQQDHPAAGRQAECHPPPPKSAVVTGAEAAKVEPKPKESKPSLRRAPTSTARSCPARSPAWKPNWPTNNSCTPSARASTA